VGGRGSSSIHSSDIDIIRDKCKAGTTSMNTLNRTPAQEIPAHRSRLRVGDNLANGVISSLHWLIPAQAPRLLHTKP